MATTGDDCYFFYYSSCAKGGGCTFRHVKEALGSEVMCVHWQNGTCRRENCSFRHMEILKPRNNTPCFYENQSTGCQKPHCVFMHYKPRNQFGTITSAQNTGLNATDANAKEDDTTPASRSSNNNSPAAEIESPRVEPLVVNPFEEESDQESPATSPVKKPSGAAAVKPAAGDSALLRLAAKNAGQGTLPKTVKLGTTSEENLDFGVKSLESLKEEKIKKIKDDIVGTEQLLHSRSVISSHHEEPEEEATYEDPPTQIEVEPVGRRIVVSSDPSRPRTDVMSRLGLRCRSPDREDPDAAVPPTVIRTRIDPDRIKQFKRTNVILREDFKTDSDEEVKGRLGQTKIVFNSEDSVDQRSVKSRLGTKVVIGSEDGGVKGRLGQTQIVCSSDEVNDGRTSVENSRNVETSGKPGGIKSRLGFNKIKFDSDDTSSDSRKPERTRILYDSDKPDVEKGGIKSRLGGGALHERYNEADKSKGIKSRLGGTAITPIKFDIDKKEEVGGNKRSLASRLGHHSGTNYDSDGPGPREAREAGGRRGGSNVTHSDGDEFEEEEVGRLGRTRIHLRKDSPKRQRSKPDAYYSSEDSIDYSPSSESEDERQPSSRRGPRSSAAKVPNNDDEDIMNQRLSPTFGDIEYDDQVEEEAKVSAEDLEKEKEEILQMLKANKQEERRLRKMKKKEKKAKKKAKKEERKKKKLLKQGLLVEDENSNSSVDQETPVLKKVVITDRLGFKAETLKTRKDHEVRLRNFGSEEDSPPRQEVEVKVKPRANNIWSRRKNNTQESSDDPAPVPTSAPAPKVVAPAAGPRRKRPAPVPYQPPAARRNQGAAEPVVEARKPRALSTRIRPIRAKEPAPENSPESGSPVKYDSPSPPPEEQRTPPRKHVSPPMKGVSPLKRGSFLSEDNNDDKKRKWGVKTFSEIMREKRLQGEQAKKRRLQRLGRASADDNSNDAITTSEPAEAALDTKPAPLKTRRPFRSAVSTTTVSQEKPTLTRKRPAASRITSSGPSDLVLESEESNSASVDDVSAKQPKIDNDDDDLGSDPELELGNFEEIKTTSTPAPVTAKHQPIDTKSDSFFDDDLGALLGDMDAVVSSTTGTNSPTTTTTALASSTSKADDSLFNELADLLAD